MTIPRLNGQIITGFNSVYTGDSSRLSRSKCGLKLCPKCSTQRTSARWCPFQTSHSGRVEPNWIFFHDVVCYPWSCHPTLALYGRKSSLPASLVNEAFNDNMSDELLVQHEWNLIEARRFTSLHLCRATTLTPTLFQTSSFSRAIVELFWSVKFDMTLARPKRVVWNWPFEFFATIIALL